MIHNKQIKNIVCLILLIFSTETLYAQKPILPDTAYKNWSDVTNGIISPDGKYAAYQVRAAEDNLRKLVFTSTNKSWYKEFQSAGDPVFSKSGTEAFITIQGVLLRIILSTDRVDTLAAINSFELSSFNGKEYLVYTTTKDTLVIASTSNKRRYMYSQVKELWKSDRSGMIVFRQTSNDNNSETLKILNLSSEKSGTIFSGKEVSNLIFDDTGTSIAFTTGKDVDITLWYFREPLAQAKPLISNASLAKGQKLSVNNFYQFSPNSDQVLFTLEAATPDYKSASDPDIWSYEDKMVYQEFKNSKYRRYRHGNNLSAINIKSGRFIRLTEPNEDVVDGDYKLQNIILFETVEHISMDESLTSYTLFNLLDGKRKILKTASRMGIKRVKIAPDQRWVIYYDADLDLWMSYEIKTGKSQSFTKEIMPQLHNYNVNRRMTQTGSLEVLGWVKGTDRVIMQGTYDLWEVSVANSLNPINLTKNGQQENSIYSLTTIPVNGCFDSKESIHIYSQDLDTKVTTLYKLNLKDRKANMLMSGNFYWASPYLDVPPIYFQKATQSEAYLFKLPSVEETPNYYFSTDFKTSFKLSDIYPEHSYNWLSSELLNYQDDIGQQCQAILYKPENFDPSKKYPVIFSIYNEQSQWLHRPLNVELPDCGLDIPTIVSSGYLVCKPDMYIDKGKVGPSILRSINAVSDYLSQFSWVDTSKMGLEGHSYGGWEVSYILTKTSRFAAAMEGAGVSNMIVSYNDLFGNTGQELRGYVTDGYYWMGETIESNLSNYLDHSPLINAKKITTPLLMYHNPDDKNVPFYHATHFFLQLRSLGKKVWLLSYPDEGHLLRNVDHKKDFLYRVKSFFDYHLMNTSKPEWLSRHIEY